MRLRGILLPLMLAMICSSALADEEPKPEPNAYLAKAGLARGELVEFLERMQSKPESIRRRPGFSEAIVDAADRILAGGAEDEPATAALEAKFAALHAMSLAGQQEADETLAKLAKSLAEDKREKIVALVRFHRLERAVRDADGLDEEQLPALLTELKQFYEREMLDNRHLRIASGTVRIINRLKDDKAAAEAYRQFGSWFAKSKDPELARYGRKIAKGAKGSKPAEGEPAIEP